MLIFLENNQFNTITYIEKPAHVLYTEKEVAPQDLKLRGFIWLEERRPKSVEDIFRRE
jgi:hypothetical protein